MPFKFIDYSGVYFRTSAKKVMPPERGGKGMSVYHANIVVRFCMLNGNIQGKYNSKKVYFRSTMARGKS